ncbi:hypothetical protein NV379_14115 [Paenibacillus sp. N1-5-1-14]|uniref:hypothetical protein n=1 Tax=Paenibacillus radicibacter TaxID=2972488 RepID=UPI002158D5C4|nr:hypothetical protein [Paenibacillus radicibacter]MCR8643787.1 hypothetical protein [Paenibacillus radicibacter]
MIQFVDYLFIVSSATLVIGLIINGAASFGESRKRIVPSPTELDKDLREDVLSVQEKDGNILGAIIRSYLVWIGFIGMVVSILLPKYFI